MLRMYMRLSGKFSPRPMYGATNLKIKKIRHDWIILFGFCLKMMSTAATIDWQPAICWMLKPCTSNITYGNRTIKLVSMHANMAMLPEARVYGTILKMRKSKKSTIFIQQLLGLRTLISCFVFPLPFFFAESLLVICSSSSDSSSIDVGLQKERHIF